MITKQEALAIMAYTGVVCVPFDAFHEYAERVLGRPIFTHEFASEKTMEELKEKTKRDFLAMVEHLWKGDGG